MARISLFLARYIAYAIASVGAWVGIEGTEADFMPAANAIATGVVLVGSVVVELWLRKKRKAKEPAK